MSCNWTWFLLLLSSATLAMSDGRLRFAAALLAPFRAAKQGLTSFHSQSTTQFADFNVSAECASVCSHSTATSASWTLPQPSELHSAICTLPASVVHVALCVRMTNATDSIDDGADSSVLDASLVDGSESAFDIVHSGISSDGGFVWCLTRRNVNNIDSDVITTIALWSPPKLIAVLLPRHIRNNEEKEINEPSTPCNHLNGSSSELLWFACENPLPIVGSLIGILSGIVLVGLVMSAMRAFRHAQVNVITIGSTSDHAVGQLASLLGLRPTPVHGLFDVPSKMRLQGRGPSTVVLYCSGVGRPMDPEELASELRSVVETVDRKRTVCVVMSNDGAMSLVSRLMRENIGVVEVVRGGGASVKWEILDNIS